LLHLIKCASKTAPTASEQTSDQILTDHQDLFELDWYFLVV